MGLVTGGARGIGEAVAIELAANGADIVVCDIAPPAAASRTIEIIESGGRRALYFQGDVGDRSCMEELFAEADRVFGRLDILVNNAAINVRKPLVDLEIEDVDKVWSVIMWGAFHCSQLAARRMIARREGGNIVTISSVHAVRAFPLSTAYNAAKAAVAHMARTWAAELAPHRIRVNVVEPGWIDTPGERSFYTEDQIRESGQKLPLARLGSPEEIAHAVAYLVSEDAAYVTGSCLRVDGGIVLPH